MRYIKVKAAITIIPNPTKKMKKFFLKRTAEHINRVRNVIKRINKLNVNVNRETLSRRGIRHDRSKYCDYEYVPFVWLTENYREGSKYNNNLPKDIEKITRKAVNHHHRVNRHHPEYHKDVRDMTNEDIGEMVADWTAMSQELGGSTKDWADKHIGKRWKFTRDQVKLIYKIIKGLKSRK